MKTVTEVSRTRNFRLSGLSIVNMLRFLCIMISVILLVYNVFVLTFSEKRALWWETTHASPRGDGYPSVA